MKTQFTHSLLFIAAVSSTSITSAGRLYPVGKNSTKKNDRISLLAKRLKGMNLSPKSTDSTSIDSTNNILSNDSNANASSSSNITNNPFPKPNLTIVTTGLKKQQSQNDAFIPPNSSNVLNNKENTLPLNNNIGVDDESPKTPESNIIHNITCPDAPSKQTLATLTQQSMLANFGNERVDIIELDKSYLNIKNHYRVTIENVGSFNKSSKITLSAKSRYSLQEFKLKITDPHGSQTFHLHVPAKNTQYIANAFLKTCQTSKVQNNGFISNLNMIQKSDDIYIEVENTTKNQHRTLILTPHISTANRVLFLNTNNF